MSMQLQNTSQAIHYIQSLPVNLQQELIDWINVFKEKQVDEPKPTAWQLWKKEHQTYLDNLGFEIGDDEPSELQKSFLEWEVYRQKMISQYDDNEMSDEEFDELLSSLKDKNDIGREVSFD